MPSSAVGSVDLRGQLGQLRARLNSDPEYAWRLGRWKESVSRMPNLECDCFCTRRRRCVIASTCSGFCSPINFNVMCSDSGRTQRASGAKPLTPSRKRAILARISASRSMPMKIRILSVARRRHGHPRPLRIKRATAAPAGSSPAPAAWQNWRMRLRSPGKLRSTTCVPSSPASAM